MIKKNRSILYISLTILLIVCILLSFCFFYISKKKNINENKIKNGLIVTFHSSQNIKIKNILPLSDELGVRLNNKSVEAGGYGFIRFSVKNANNKNSSYRIYIMRNDDELPSIGDKYIKLYLTDNNDIPVEGFSNESIPCYMDLLSLSSKPLGRLIYSGNLDVGEEKSYVLRVWLSDEYMLKDEEETFNFDVFVESK